jgi:hypothetical protein
VDSLPRVPILKQFAAGLVDQVLISDRFHSREQVYGTAGR